MSESGRFGAQRSSQAAKVVIAMPTSICSIKTLVANLCRCTTCGRYFRGTETQRNPSSFLSAEKKIHGS